MTAEDHREQEKELRQRLHEAQRDLEGARLRAKHIGELLISTGELLKANPAALAGLAGQEWRNKAAQVIRGVPSGFYNESLFRDAFSFDALVAIGNECLTSQARLDDLNEDKKRKGITD